MKKILLALLLLGCPPHPVTPVADADATAPVTDGGTPQDATADADPLVPDDELDAAPRYPACSAACSKLRALGCPEGQKPDGGQTCYAICAKAEASGKFNMKPACIAGAKDLSGLKSCGTVRCLK